MKNIICNLIVATLLISGQVAAQDFQSTSAMRSSGSQYTPSVTPVGSETPNYVQSPVGSLPGNTSERRRAAMEEDDFTSPEDEGRSDQFPIGDGWIMLLFAAMGAGVVAIKRHKAEKA